MANKQALKQRIKSISTTKKITGAMEMIANSKLTKLKNKAEEGRYYTDTLKQIVSDIIASNPNIDNRFFKKNNSKDSVTIVFTLSYAVNLVSSSPQISSSWRLSHSQQLTIKHSPRLLLSVSNPVLRVISYDVGVKSHVFSCKHETLFSSSL